MLNRVCRRAFLRSFYFDKDCYYGDRRTKDRIPDGRYLNWSTLFR